MRFIPLLAGLLFAAPALAQTTPTPPPAAALPGQRPPQPTPTIIVEPVAMMIAAFDRDGDARVTRAEFEAGLEASFKAIDTAGRGSLSYIGFSDWALMWLGDRNALPGAFEVDTDGDNRITLGELRARFTLFFNRFDADKDGMIVRSELVSVRTPAALPDRGQGRRGGGRRRLQ